MHRRTRARARIHSRTYKQQKSLRTDLVYPYRALPALEQHIQGFIEPLHCLFRWNRHRPEGRLEADRGDKEGRERVGVGGHGEGEDENEKKGWRNREIVRDRQTVWGTQRDQHLQAS